MLHDIYAPSITHHVGTDHTADSVLTACQSRVGVGVDLYAGLEFWTFFSLKVRGSTYMRIALYAGIYSTSRQTVDHVAHSLACSLAQ